MLTISPQSFSALSAGATGGDSLAGWLAHYGGPVPASRVDAEAWLARGKELAAAYDLLPEIEEEEERFYLATLAAMLMPQINNEQFLLLGDALVSPEPMGARVGRVRAMAAAR